MTDNIKPYLQGGFLEANRCLFCPNTGCYYAIYTKDLQFVELSCPEHSKALEIHADNMLKGKLRHHIMSSHKLNRRRIKDDINDKILKLISVILDPDTKLTAQEFLDELFDIH